MKVILIIGIQASGKTSLAEKYLAQGYVRVNRDVKGGDMAGLLPVMEKALDEGKSVVLDNTFVSVASRKPFIDLAIAKKADVKCVHVTTSLEHAQFNAIHRIIKMEGKLLTPDEIKKHKSPNVFPPAVLFSYRKSFEEPTEAEGFSSIEVIKFQRVFDKEYSNEALILDYDSTLRDCVNGNGKYPVEKDQIAIRPNVAKKLLEAKEKGMRLLGVSNQSGVHKADLTHDKAVELFSHTNSLIGVDIEVVFCPHQSAPPVCYCRKPSTGWAVHFIEKYKLLPSKCTFVGDATSDRTFAQRAGFKYIDQAEFFKD